MRSAIASVLARPASFLLPAALGVSAVLLAGLSGCEGSKPPPRDDGYSMESEQQRDADSWMASAVRDTQVTNAIVTQHTLFPYHFVGNTAQLNDLGQRDLAVLAEAYRASPGPLSVRQGTVADEVYSARVQAVTEALRHAGVDVARVTISDAPPGGPGMSSDQMMRSLSQKQPETGSYSTYGTAGSTGGTGGSGGTGGGK